jgi:predicted dehydrogenase
MLDLFRLFAGEFDEVKSLVTRSYWPIDVEDNAFVLLRNTKGQVAMLHSSSTQWKHVFSLEIFLSEGYIAINGILSGTRSYGRETLIIARKQLEHESFAPGNPREEITYFDRDLSWQREVTEFGECILSDTPVRVGSSRDALQVMDLVYRIYRSDASWWDQMSTSRLVGSPPGTAGTESPRS